MCALVPFFFGAGPFLIIVILLFFVAAYLIVGENKKKFLASRDNLNSKIAQSKEAFEKLIDENDKSDNINKGINRESKDIEDLYEVTKRMSAFLKFDEIFKILCAELKNTFEFDDCRIINIKTIRGSIQINEIYNIQIEMKISDAKTYDPKIIETVCQQKNTLKMASVKTEAEKLGLSLPRRVETVLAIPLLTEGEIRSVVIAENVRPEDFEKFAIVIGQFALETHKVKLYELVEKLAITDGLTGLLLKRHFLESLKKEIKRSLSNRLKIAILMLDIDHFKKYNDRYGHLVGDSVLIRISEIIRDHTREIDLISRYGGEEFCLALPETDKEGAYAVAERIRVQIERENFMTEGEFTRATISIGLACFPNDGRGAVQLIDMSDQALYEAKNSGRNSTCVYKRTV